MPKYDVTVLRTLVLSTTITVRAKSEEEAEKKACQMAQDSALTWDIAGRNKWNEESDNVEADNIEEA